MNADRCPVSCVGVVRLYCKAHKARYAAASARLSSTLGIVSWPTEATRPASSTKPSNQEHRESLDGHLSSLTWALQLDLQSRWNSSAPIPWLCCAVRAALGRRFRHSLLMLRRRSVSATACCASWADLSSRRCKSKRAQIS